MKVSQLQGQFCHFRHFKEKGVLTLTFVEVTAVQPEQKGSARAALLQKCNAKIISETFVYKLQSNDKKVSHAHYYDKDKISHVIEAKIFVVAAQAIESARLLLNSKNNFFQMAWQITVGKFEKILSFLPLVLEAGVFILKVCVNKSKKS